MEQLSSCYFCGGALDASLDEYPVVPDPIRDAPEAEQSIVLCQTCKRKLDAVVESVAEAARTGAAEGAAADSHDGAADAAESNGEPSNADESGAETSEIEQTLGDDSDVLRPIGEDENAGNGSGRSTGRDEPADDAAEQPGETDADASASSADASDSGSADSPTYSGGRRAGHNTTSVESGDDEDDSDDETESKPPKSEATLTRLENTKVMRLLQNREFPVDQEEFVTVASSAYEISRSDCEKVLSLAVEHDLLDERNGQLVAGARWS